MLNQDVPIWYRFLETWGHLFERLFYDVLLGGPIVPEIYTDDRYWKMWRANLSKRADAVAETKDEVWIIEVADTPGLRSVGQLMVYRSLWIEDPKIMKPERAVLVCNAIDTDLIASGARYGMLVYVMPGP